MAANLETFFNLAELGRLGKKKLRKISLDIYGYKIIHSLINVGNRDGWKGF